MNNLRQLCAAVVLISMLTLSTFAGEIGFPQMPPPTAPASVTVQGQMETPRTSADESSSEVSAVDPVAEITLSLLQSVLALF